jgi:bifunctional ADP-heptose synthase (sugar kinase/adenylyltransferase)
MIKYGASLGELYIGIDSDRRVKEKKGSSRPFNSENVRREFLESLRGVKKVYIFDTDEELQNIVKRHKPDYHVIGEEYSGKDIIGSEFSGKIIFFPKVEGYSTTKISEHENTCDRGTMHR